MPSAGPSKPRQANVTDEVDNGADERKTKKQKFLRSRQACLQVSVRIFIPIDKFTVTHTEPVVPLEEIKVRSTSSRSMSELLRSQDTMYLASRGWPFIEI